MMMIDTTIGGIPGVRLNAPVTRQIRSQAMAVARTATASMAGGEGDGLQGSRCARGFGVGVKQRWIRGHAQPACLLISSGGTGRQQPTEWPLHQLQVSGGAGDPEDTEFADQQRTLL